MMIQFRNRERLTLKNHSSPTGTWRIIDDAEPVVLIAHRSSGAPNFRPNLRLLKFCIVFLAVAIGVIDSAIFPYRLMLPAMTLSPSLSIRCKYSVRDVAFVNVHGNSWQLQLIKPDWVSDSKFESWNMALTSRLKHTNVSHIWFGEDTPQASQIRRLMNQSRDLSRTDPDSTEIPLMALTGPNDQIIPIPESPLDFARRLDQLLNSPIRKRITDNVVESLCVFVLIESGDANLDDVARKIVGQAIEQVDRQMWTLEKPTDKGPVMVNVPYDASEDESWLLASLERENNNAPSVAVIYGQARQLGEALSGDSLTVENLVDRAAVCGQDCECNLDRKWLYGQQFVHSWNTQLERAAENSLTFDPHSAFVIAEVSQIIRKNSINNGQSERVLVGGGLVIHDLEPIKPPSDYINPESDRRDSPLPAAVNPETSTLRNGPDIHESLSPGRDNPAAIQTVRWVLIGGLFMIAMVIFGWRKIVTR